jgi:hypothetical protein
MSLSPSLLRPEEFDLELSVTISGGPELDLAVKFMQDLTALRRPSVAGKTTPVREQAPSLMPAAPPKDIVWARKELAQYIENPAHKSLMSTILVDRFGVKSLDKVTDLEGFVKEVHLAVNGAA